MRSYFLANRKKLLARMKVINAKPEQIAKRAAYYNPVVAKEAVRAYRERHPEKLKAWWTFTNAVRAGKLIAPDACSRCGEGGLIDGHHHDYSKPLEVTWLCRPCHIEAHLHG
jgi:hypothetical protein